MEIAAFFDHLLCLIIVPSNSHLFYFNLCVCLCFCSIFNMLPLDLACVDILDNRKDFQEIIISWCVKSLDDSKIYCHRKIFFYFTFSFFTCFLYSLLLLFFIYYFFCREEWKFWIFFGALSSLWQIIQGSWLPRTLPEKQFDRMQI